MISYMMVFLAFLALHDIVPKVWYHIWYHIWYWFFYDIMYDITKCNYKKPFLRYSCMILAKISYIYQLVLAMISVSSDIIGTFHTITPMISFLISLSSDIIGLWYHNFHDILAHIMVPARQNGAGCGRHSPGAPPPLASP